MSWISALLFGFLRLASLSRVKEVFFICYCDVGWVVEDPFVQTDGNVLLEVIGLVDLVDLLVHVLENLLDFFLTGCHRRRLLLALLLLL